MYVLTLNDARTQFIMDIERYRNLGLFLALAAVWGTSFVAIETGLESLPPLLFAALRYDIAGLLLFIYAGVVGGRWRPRSREEWTLVGLGGTLLIGVHFALAFVGQQYVSGAVAAVVLSLTPVVTPLFALLVLPDERLSAAQVLGVGLGLVGVVVIAQPSPSALGDEFFGVVLLVGSALSFAFGTVLTRRFSVALPTASMQAWMMILGAGLLHATSALAGERMGIEWSLGTLGSLLYLAVVASAGGLLVYFNLLEDLGPNEVSLVNYVVPVFAALGGWVLLGEAITPTTLLGFCVIALGFAFIEAEPIREALSPGESETITTGATTNTVIVGENVYYREIE